MAGIAVAGTIFVFDLVRGDPLGTPLALSQSLLVSGLGFESGEVFGKIDGLSPGGRLALFTAAYLAAWALAGMLAAGAANLFHVHWNTRNGGILGLLGGLLAWLILSRAGPVWVASAYLSPEIVLGSGLLGGAVLGWFLRACHVDAEADA
jgi:hypothetical protein